ncbi:GINS complex subunit [Tieghemiomyces parasiticus]|uniref:GINS complex subunit n=1 Tax=Tieghemiomyces parasiticus TaxID=78921 RepID=A0A9W8ADX5_9FUNG|nr:GINS complex subunit [Tieghemiomyces parasiticus]
MDSPFPHDPPSRYAYPPADPDAMEPDIDAMLDGALGSYGQTDEGPDGDFRNEDVRLLAQAWANEKQAPELLPYEDQLVGDLTEMVQNQLQLIEAVQEENSDQAFLAMLYQHEVERVKFVLRSYLKTRLRKLERHVIWYTASNDYQVRMAPGERAFAARYRALFTSHMQRACLNHLPESLRALDDTNGNVSMSK